nr:unnamed protein product [Callosobruchus chinensis]
MEESGFLTSEKLLLFFLEDVKRRPLMWKQAPDLVLDANKYSQYLSAKRSPNEFKYCAVANFYISMIHIYKT